MKVLVLLTKSKDPEYKVTSKVLNYLDELGFDIYLRKEVFEDLNRFKEIDEDNLKSIDFALVLGGDGSILREAHRYKDYNLNFLGINLGRVGCLTEGKPEDYKRIIDSIHNNEYKIEKRIVLDCTIKKDDEVMNKISSFNEVTIIRGKSLKMLKIELKLNKMHKTVFYADGINVSTPTGSSAYSLSSGGPLLISTANSFVLTPICPQLRTITSLVIDGDDELTISLKNNFKDPALLPSLEIDGRESFDINDSFVVTLNKSNRTLNIVKVNLDEPLYEPIFKVTNTII